MRRFRRWIRHVALVWLCLALGCSSVRYERGADGVVEYTAMSLGRDTEGELTRIGDEFEQSFQAVNESESFTRFVGAVERAVLYISGQLTARNESDNERAVDEARAREDGAVRRAEIEAETEQLGILNPEF